MYGSVRAQSVHKIESEHSSLFLRDDVLQDGSMDAVSAYLELACVQQKQREACRQIRARQMAARGSTPPNHAACIASSSPQGRIRCCHHCGPSAAQRCNTYWPQQRMDASERTRRRRCSRQSTASNQSFLSLRRAGPHAAAASPELLFYLSPVTCVSPMGRRAAWPPSCILVCFHHIAWQIIRSHFSSHRTAQ
jgi:hypothetical protein